MNEQNVPIDIAVRKLQDWLISRRICSRDWHDKVVQIRANIGAAMQDMPENEAIRELLVGTHINYFHCLKIIDILKETEKDSKNFFGQYGSKRMKDWKQIVSDYEADSIYLSEAGQILTQNVVYELPGLKKHCQKLDALQAECDKKEENAIKRITELEEEFRKQCKDIGIEGVKLKTEIMSLARHLPETYSSIAADARQLDPACILYQNFVQERTVDDEVGPNLKVLETLRFLIEQGNVTTYEWKYGEKPLSVEEPLMQFDDDDAEMELVTNNAAVDEIDFGEDNVIDFDEAEDNGIDFGDDIDDNGEIDFGDTEIVEYPDNDDRIDFDIETIDTSSIVIEEAGLQGGVARDEEARSLLDNRRTRAIIIDDLEELAGFLQQRLVETESEHMKFTISAGGHQNHDPQTLKKMMALVDSVSCRLTEAKIQQLQTIRDSPVYADRVVETLKKKQKLKVKVLSSIDGLKERRQQLAAEKEEELNHIATLNQSTKLLKKQIETDISGRYKGRTVIISGV